MEIKDLKPGVKYRINHSHFVGYTFIFKKLIKDNCNVPRIIVSEYYLADHYYMNNPKNETDVSNPIFWKCAVEVKDTSKIKIYKLW